MYVEPSTVISLVALLTALYTLFKYYNKIFTWVKKQENQDKDIQNIKKEMTLICYCMSATLDGLMQLNCNHSVPVAKDKLDKYINQKAHDQED